MRNARGVLVWLPTLSFLFLATALRTSAQSTSTPEERVQWVETTHKLESSPLDDSVNKQGEAAFKRLSDVHDVHVLLCPALLSEFNGMKYAYAHTITRQYMLASGAFQIENPDKAADAAVFFRGTAGGMLGNRLFSHTAFEPKWSFSLVTISIGETGMIHCSPTTARVPR